MVYLYNEVFLVYIDESVHFSIGSIPKGRLDEKGSLGGMCDGVRSE